MVRHQNPVRFGFTVNEQIAGEGETGSGLYVLLEGRVGVFKHNRQIAEFKQCGIIFGELSVILGTPRTATLIALEPAKVVHFDVSLEQLVADYPDVTSKVMVYLAERLAKTTDDLIAVVEKDGGTKWNFLNQRTS